MRRRLCALLGVAVLAVAACGWPVSRSAGDAASGAAGRVTLAGGRFVVHGRPTFVRGVYDTGLGYSAEASEFERMLFAPGGDRELSTLPGLNLYINYQYGQMPLSSFRTFLDVLDRHGVTALVTANCFDKSTFEDYQQRYGRFSAQDDAFIRGVAEHRALFGYYVMDECVPEVLDSAAATIQRLRRLDPRALTFGTLLGRPNSDPRPWVPWLDVMATDPYPLYGDAGPYALSAYVGDEVARLRAVTPAERPIVAVLQMFRFASGPLPDVHARDMAIMAIVEGAQGLVWWQVGAAGLRNFGGGARREDVPSAYAAIRSVFAETTRLEPALVEPDSPRALVGNSSIRGDSAVDERRRHIDVIIKEIKNDYDRRAFQAERETLARGDTARSAMLGKRGQIRTRVVVKGDRGYVWAYNYLPVATDVTFTWRQNVAGVMRDGARLPITPGARWSDRFEPYQGHVYEITPE